MKYAEPQVSSMDVPTLGNDAIEILENDHRRIRHLLAKLTEGEIAQRASTLESLKQTLTIHNSTEEALVYPALHEIAGHKSQATKLYHETSEADIVLWRLSMIHADDSSFEPLAQMLRTAIDRHIVTEEESEFPRLRDAANSAQQLTLAAEVKKFRERFH